MFNLFDGEHHGWISFTDFFAGACAVFLLVAALMVFQIIIPTKKDKEGDIKAVGTVMVETFWKENCDVDVWVRSPGDNPVGYSRKQGRYFDLLRDDLGNPRELDAGMHHENVFARGAPEGKYVVNLHMYSNHNNEKFPIEVEVDVEVTKNDNGKTDAKTIIHTKVQLDHLGEEITVVQFSLDDHAELVPGSINHDQTPLRSAQ